MYYLAKNDVNYYGQNWVEIEIAHQVWQHLNIFFGAFRHDINAFRLCRPVISVKCCHLMGLYKGEMLVDVTKDANNNILPADYAIVDEETSHSWCWFFLINLDILLLKIDDCVLFQIDIKK